MTIELFIPESMEDRVDQDSLVEFRFFLQAVVNRFCVGALRYGAEPDQRKKYMTRLQKEMKAYATTGNAEQLMNVAVYAYLESAAPENRKFHFDNTAVSVTRGKV